MNNKEISLEQKAIFVLDYLYNNFLIMKDRFIKKFNLQPDYFNNKQVIDLNLLKEDYFNNKQRNNPIHFNYMFFDISFHHKLEKLVFNIIHLKSDLNDKPFFVIELPSEEEKIQFKKIYENSKHKFKNNVLENMIKDKNKIIQLLLSATDNSLCIQELFTRDLNSHYIERLYELIKLQKNINNF